jgi:dolichyl-phosphate beta-glucosyltransferase
MSVSIVLPAYNEAERIMPSLDELFTFIQSRVGAALPRPIDVLVVDDGGKDATAALVAARPEAVGSLQEVTLRVLSIPHGGKGAAVRAGMLQADSDLIVFADADMATPPDQLPALIAALSSHDIALGSRIQADRSDMRATQPAHRRLLGKVFHFLASIWVVGPVQDTQCGFKGFTREAAHDLFALQRIASIVFDVELIFLARRRGYRMAVVPIRWSDKRGSRMTARPRLAARVAWDLVRIPVLHRSVRRR